MFLRLLHFVACVACARAALRFDANGTFKILQVADMHVGTGRYDQCMNVAEADVSHCTGQRTLEFVNRVSEIENPDLIVFTGDQIDGAATDARAALDMVIEPAEKRGKAWVAVLGNHDGESSLSRREVFAYMSSKAGGLMPDTLSDYVLTITNDNATLVTPLWFIDSGGSHALMRYEWVSPKQLTWMYHEYAKMRAVAMVSGSHVSWGLAFWHIPIPEFAPSYLQDIVGWVQERVSSSHVNSGLYGTLLNCGVRVGLVGHDHINDYCGEHKWGGMCLCYGGGSGYHTYGKSGWPRRVRVIEFEDWGRQASTWMRLDMTNATCAYPTENRRVLFSERSDVSEQDDVCASAYAFITSDFAQLLNLYTYPILFCVWCVLMLRM